MATKEQLLDGLRKAFQGTSDIPQDKMLFTYNGVIYPSATCNIPTFKTIETFEAREDDIMLVAYPKCGSNWSMKLLHDMVHAIYNIGPSSVIPLIEFGLPDKFEKLKEEPSPRVLETHLHYDNIPKPFFEKNVKMLVVFRNPKDTAASMFHFYKNNPLIPSYNSWDEFFPDFMAGKVVWGSYFDHAVAWNKHLNEKVLLMTFENMKEDLEGSVKKISEFFRISLTEEQVKLIAETGTFKSMKENSNETHGDFAKVLFRKGEIGDWKNHFTKAQSEEMDAKFEECLAETKLGNMLKYDVYCKW
ncbi:sulfotransferase 6B1-like [Pseudophryne corroboree]|uniref:sulfotransferase 6B1-like n=1 Tax=Pseudophryne corroboree TaxID=495146 RepID=UPI003081B4BC